MTDPVEDEGLVFHERPLELPTKDYYSTTDVARIFRVDVKTVTRWIAAGKFEERGLQIHLTFGGHRRFAKDDIHKLFALMLDGKLYNEDGSEYTDETGSVSRIDNLPASDSDHQASD